MKRTVHTKSDSDTESVVTSADVLGDAKALAAKVTSLVGAPPALTKVDVLRSTKLRKGGEGIIPTLSALSEQVGLVVPSTPTAMMTEKLALAQSLVPLHKQLVVATKHVGDALFLAESQSWEAASVHYWVLRRLAKKDGDLAKALAPVTQFFAARSAAVKAEEKEQRDGAKADAKVEAQTSETQANAANGATATQATIAAHS